MELHVSVKITPHQDKIDPAKMDELLDGELVEFEKWFISRQRQRGLHGGGFIAAERGMLKTYIVYLSTKEES